MPNEPEESTPSRAQGRAKRPTLSEQLATAQAEIEELRRTNDALANQSLNTWLVVVSDEARALSQVYSTLSWRITKPLRLARQVQIKVKEVGVTETAAVVGAGVKRRLGTKA
jgi:hypothetical protein